ncbi:hypothetical protein BKA81DRAFT_126226 [Phyllosticta paracitricarpa]|uniref:Uncharacterized protein n=2 Tax=Phyllosticta TaxID=121621 RepID=A0ABR1MLJ3_9PEZI
MARSGHRRSMYIAAHFQRLLVLISKIGACVSTTDIDCARDDGQNYYRGEGAAAAAAAAAWGRQFASRSVFRWIDAKRGFPFAAHGTQCPLLSVSSPLAEKVAEGELRASKRQFALVLLHFAIKLRLEAASELRVFCDHPCPCFELRPAARGSSSAAWLDVESSQLHRRSGMIGAFDASGWSTWRQLCHG